METKPKKKTAVKEKSKKPIKKAKKIKQESRDSRDYFHHPFGMRWMWMMA